LSEPVRLTIRAYDPDSDYPAVRRCFVELQETERAIDPDMPAGDDIAEAYLDKLFERGREYDGVVLIADLDGAVAGYVAVFRRYHSDEPDDDPSDHAYLSDLVVAKPHRGTGVGRALLRAAEECARAAGAPVIRLGVKAGNDPALALYAKEGFRESVLMLAKQLR